CSRCDRRARHGGVLERALEARTHFGDAVRLRPGQVMSLSGILGEIEELLVDRDLFVADDRSLRDRLAYDEAPGAGHDPLRPASIGDDDPFGRVVLAPRE